MWGGLSRVIFWDSWVRMRFVFVSSCTNRLKGVLVVFAKLSDIFGRKLIFSIAICTFIVFSAACGASQTLQQL